MTRGSQASIAHMLSQIGKFYARRVINVNVNILLAGLLALLPTVVIVHLATSGGDQSWAARKALYFGVSTELVINGVTFVSDLIFDIAILYSLHYLANHWPRAWHLRKEARDKPHLTYWADATLVQMERMVLSPLMYGLFLGVQHVLLHQGVGPEISTVAGYIAGGAVTRTLHTLWMVRCERKQLAEFGKVSVAAAQTPASTLEPSPIDLGAKPAAVKTEVSEHVGSV